MPSPQDKPVALPTKAALLQRAYRAKYMAVYGAEYREKHKLEARVWRAKNSAILNEKARAYRAKNPNMMRSRSLKKNMA